MCGIAGLIYSRPRQLDLRLLEKVLASLRHRGPDDWGCFAYGPNGAISGRELSGNDWVQALAIHRRLSILDLSEAGWQPMKSRDNRYYLLFNGEIYNYLELRMELERLGHLFRSRSDTEVLLAAYSEWGIAGFPRFIGMFAFAIFDSVEEKIVLARDCFGIKPLYYSCHDGVLAFASEIPAILEMQSVPRTANAQRVFDYLRFGLVGFGSETLFAGVRQLPPGHYVEISLSSPTQVTPKRYWDVPQPSELRISPKDAADMLRELFLESVRLHLRSDVPVGTALSGGVDSSAIVAAMRHVAPDAEIHAFSYFAEEPEICEERYARLAAGRARAELHPVRLAPDKVPGLLATLVAIHGEPFRSTSMCAQYEVFRSARARGIKVMLDGQGADEVLAGYPAYRGARLASLVRRKQWVDVFRFLKSCGVYGGRRQLAIYAGAFLLPTEWQTFARRVLGEQLIPDWIDSRWLAKHEVDARPFRGGYAGTDILHQDLRESLTRASLPALLQYEDRNSMAHSVESRVPFLNPRIVEFAFGLPDELLVSSHGETKSLFRKAMRGLVPDPILDRRDKIAFNTPERKWLKEMTTWMDQALASKTAERIPAFKIGELRQEWARIRRTSKSLTTQAWRWVSLIQWNQQFNVEYD